MSAFIQVCLHAEHAETGRKRSFRTLRCIIDPLIAGKGIILDQEIAGERRLIIVSNDNDAASLIDRIRIKTGKIQCYGTVFVYRPYFRAASCCDDAILIGNHASHVRFFQPSGNPLGKTIMIPDIRVHHIKSKNTGKRIAATGRVWSLIIRIIIRKTHGVTGFVDGRSHTVSVFVIQPPAEDDAGCSQNAIIPPVLVFYRRTIWPPGRSPIIHRIIRNVKVNTVDPSILICIITAEIHVVVKCIHDFFDQVGTVVIFVSVFLCVIRKRIS